MLYVQSDGELVDHLFLHCEVERELWSLISCLFRVCCIIPRTVLEVLASRKGPFGKKIKFRDLEDHFYVSNMVYLKREEHMDIQRTGSISYSTEVSVYNPYICGNMMSVL